MLLRMNSLLMSVHLPLRDAIAIVVFSALGAHAIFKRWEPLCIPIVSSLLFFAPAAVSTLLVSHFGVPRGLVLGFSIYFTTLLSSIVIYRISPFHPLARYPGPLLAKVTKFYHVAKVYSGKQQRYAKQMHETYGDIVRTGPNEVIIRDASCITPLLGSQGFPKGPMYEGRHLWPKVPSLIGLRDPKEHQRRRRPWNRAFNTASLKDFNPIIQHRHGLDIFTYDFMGDLVYGGWTEMLREGGDHNGLWKVLKSGIKASFVYEHMPWLSYYGKMLPGGVDAIKKMHAMAFSQTEKRYASGSTSRDLFYFLGNEDGAEKVDPPRSLVISDGLLALIAGADTTSTVLASTFYCILRNPEAYKRLQAEVDKFYPPGEDSLDPRHLPEMQYLEAILMETLRLFPAVPSGSQRAPEIGTGGKAIGPYYIPEGTQTRVSFLGVHRDPRNFTHPDMFWPDRWLIAEGLQTHKEEIVHNPNAWVPFSFGPSNCVGKNLAMQEMRILVCHLVQRFNFRFEDGYDPAQFERDIEDRFVVVIRRLPVVVERRD
ncbi:uncharacterized protein PHACADRAFT_212308 [Phanerochaete carnosa HHB-10118-sp]|uniref:High nitrogen upregulated cytochrome P450 monooxygenase 2 n=1 Tax=Phanerochaete carnosa (strain HHB-10118-sp) TaxID=650164 RepID=K5UPH1_PHACS|nr:uncharacterized protein PHACADRAFT_212308 [Phanerochaete carnosa HHB-10118-sp]EKM51676.1 hypothetical protein PHACADRAFT_212308 [Phanerochaete carnosa HHB-10118-sp]